MWKRTSRRRKNRVLPPVSSSARRRRVVKASPLTAMQKEKAHRGDSR
nr:MAG TPA: hypothetical protein [Caudoviricetes sp.]